MKVSRRLRGGALVGAGLAMALVLSGCALGQLQLHAGADTAARSAAHIALTGVTLSNGKVVPGAPVVVGVTAGRLTKVDVEGPDGPLVGTLSADQRTWTSGTSTLEFGSTYKVTAAAVDRTGLPASFTKSLTTITPSKFITGYVTPFEGATVGVGYPAIVQFSRSISDAKKAAVVRHLAVSINGQPGVGSWRWETNSVVQYRTPEYFPANATIKVDLNLKGMNIGDGIYGKKNTTTTYHTGDAMVSHVDLQTHQLTVTKNGKVIRVIPITAGKPGFETRSGTKVILTKETSRLMDAATGGTAKTSPDYYKLTVYDAMRVTWSGEFLHGAPWSVGAQGSANVSHGCTGMSASNAAWLFANSRIGDVVVYTGSARKMTLDNGIGIWNLSWEQWQTTNGDGTLGFNSGSDSA